MLNTLLMAIAGLFFVGFWAYLAWDSYQDFKKHEPDQRDQGKPGPGSVIKS